MPLSAEQRARWLRVIPPPLRHGRLPHIWVVGVVMVLAMLLFAQISPDPLGAQLSLWVAGVVTLTLLVLSLGAPVWLSVHAASGAALAVIAYAAWMSGGIDSPRLAWSLLLPITPFYMLGRRHGDVWLGIVLLLLSAMAVLTQQGTLGGDVAHLGRDYAAVSWLSYQSLSVLLIVVPLVYHGLYRDEAQLSRQRTQELQTKRAQLQATLEARNQFIALVSHELRTPMNAILGFNELLLQRVGDGPSREILLHTRASADHLLTVINDVLDHSQLEAGQLKIQPEDCALPRVVHNAFALFAHRAQMQGLDYRCEIAPDVPEWVHVDRHRLVQVLVNLLGNAIKFTPQGRVLLSVTAHDGGVRFAVQDTGIGIAPDKHVRIFQRFSQADEQVQSRFGGHGLGLSISSRLVGLLGGQIGFESEVGAGSLFWFWLPLRAVAAPAAAAEPTQARSAEADHRWRFLVVDDHPINRILMCRILQSAWPQARIDEAEDGAQALDLLARAPVDLVFMDMVMPNLDGIEATRRLRASEGPQAQVPVLGLTANVHPRDLDQFLLAGVDALALKPVDPQQVLAQVERLLLQAAHPPRA